MSQDEPGLTDIDIITFNNLPPTALINNGDALQALAGSALEGATTELVNSAEGQQLLAKVVTCAIRVGDTVHFPRPDGSSLTLTGQLAIAQGWKTHGIANDDQNQRFITACLIANINARGTPFPISVRSMALAPPTLIEKLLYPAQELATYGNVFASASERELNVCFGQAVAQSLGSGGGLGGQLGLPTYLDFRVCGDSGGGATCNVNRVGACFAFRSDVTLTACETRSGDLYRKCHAVPIQEASTPAQDLTVSVFLQPGDLGLLISEYAEFICATVGLCIDPCTLPLVCDL